MTTRPNFILSVRYTPVGPAPGSSRGPEGKARGLLKYIEHRPENHNLPAVGDVDAITRYVSHRDNAASEGRLFDADGDATDEHRRQLTAYIEKSLRDLQQWRGTGPDTRRAFYQFVLSPADARGLDLRKLARAAMAELGRDAGAGGLPPWLAAEHRNTKHPHVHIVMAARREVAPGQFRGLQLHRGRLARMKEAVDLELTLQRSRHLKHSSWQSRQVEDVAARWALHHGRGLRMTRRDAAAAGDQATRRLLDQVVPARRRRLGPLQRAGFEIGQLAYRLARYHARKAEELARMRHEQVYDPNGWEKSRSR